MSTPYNYLNRDHLLRDTVSWEARSGASRDNSYDVTATYAAAVTLRCIIGAPSSRWATAHPQPSLLGSIELWLPGSSTVAKQDRVTVTAGQNAGAYDVINVHQGRGAYVMALCERIAGVT